MADWQVGDLALCVCPHRTPLGHPRVKTGGCYEVEAIDQDGDLVLRGHYSRHPTRGHWAPRFIKVTPEAEDAFDRETIALLTGEPATVRL